MPRPEPRPGSWRAMGWDTRSHNVKPLSVKTLQEMAAGRRMQRAKIGAIEPHPDPAKGWIVK